MQKDQEHSKLYGLSDREVEIGETPRMRMGSVFGLGALEVVVILVVVVLVFGVGRLPELGTGLGEGIKNFKKSYRDSKAIDVTAEDRTDSPSKPKDSQN